MSITRQQVVRATTNSPWTREFKHLQSFPRYWIKRTSWKDPFVKSVRPNDRIKYWNIVPGDQIRLLGDKSNTIHEVLSINKISNRVFLKGSPNTVCLPITNSRQLTQIETNLYLGRDTSWKITTGEERSLLTLPTLCW
jgi:hypothetical protein